MIYLNQEHDLLNRQCHVSCTCVTFVWPREIKPCPLPGFNPPFGGVASTFVIPSLRCWCGTLLSSGWQSLSILQLSRLLLIIMKLICSVSMKLIRGLKTSWRQINFIIYVKNTSTLKTHKKEAKTAWVHPSTTSQCAHCELNSEQSHTFHHHAVVSCTAKHQCFHHSNQCVISVEAHIPKLLLQSHAKLPVCWTS